MHRYLPTIASKRIYSRHKLLIWAAIVSLIAGVVQFGEPLDQALRILRNKTHSQPASGDIVIAGIDDRSVRRVGPWPWREREYARMVDRLNALGAKRIIFAVHFSDYAGSLDHRMFEAALSRSSAQVFLATRFVVDPVTGGRTEITPPPGMASRASLANANAWNDALTGVWDLPFALTTNGISHPSIAAVLGDRRGADERVFPIDHSIEIGSVPVVDAAAINYGDVARKVIAGKDVVIGTTSRQFGDMLLLPGKGPTPQVFAHVLGGETLKRGEPYRLGWLAPLLAAFVLALGATKLRSRRVSRLLLALGLAGIVFIPLPLEHRLILVDIVPAAMLIGIVGGARAWARFRRQTIGTNPLSGLPNLNALRDEAWAPNTALVAARVQNFSEITATLPHDLQQALVGQIVHRIGVSSDRARIYHGEEGLFAWLVNKAASHSIGDELEALHALFRSPIVVDNRHIDLDLSFGVEMSGDRRLANRLGSALVAADEAYAEGSRWKAYDPAKLESAEWRLSLLSRLDVAIDSGEIWVAFQPKLDIATRQITGAEALARWTHPEKGDISPEDFVLAAEQHNRIEKLSAHVFGEAIRAAALVNARGTIFNMSVNLSVRLLDDPNIVGMISGLLSRHALPPELLTLEVTESAALTNGGTALATLDKLRLLGLGVSLDDYGTGFSTLEYLKKVPANEIKIDKTFVGAMHKSRSDQLMVSSTIELAHSLDRRVVAEGVERMDTLEALAAMGCDAAQGYLIGRPMPFNQFYSWLAAERVPMVA